MIIWMRRARCVPIGESEPVLDGHSRTTEGDGLTCNAPVSEAWQSSSQADSPQRCPSRRDRAW